jgi:hypothetical protein
MAGVNSSKTAPDSTVDLVNHGLPSIHGLNTDVISFNALRDRSGTNVVASVTGMVNSLTCVLIDAEVSDLGILSGLKV